MKFTKILHQTIDHARHFSTQYVSTKIHKKSHAQPSQETANIFRHIGLDELEPPNEAAAQFFVQKLKLLLFNCSTYNPTPHLNHRRLFKQRIRPDLVQWLFESINENTHDTLKTDIRTLAYRFSSHRRVPKAYMVESEIWLKKTFKEYQFQSKTNTYVPLEHLNNIVFKACQTAHHAGFQINQPCLHPIPNSRQDYRLGFFSVRNTGYGEHSSIHLNEALLSGQFKHLSPLATEVLAISCLMHELQHALQHHFCQNTHDTATQFSQDDYAKWLGIFNFFQKDAHDTLALKPWGMDIPEHIHPNYLLPHEIQAWQITVLTKEILKSTNHPNIEVACNEVADYLKPITQHLPIYSASKSHSNKA